MRTSSVVTISLPPTMVKEAIRIAKKQHMTRSELIRVALREYLERQDFNKAVRVYDKEKREGKLMDLDGSLVDLMA